MATPKDLAVKMLANLHRDKPKLERIDHYLHGHHDDPYMPENADKEYKLLAERCVTNVMPFVVNTPVQAMYVDSFRRGRTSADSAAPSSEREIRVQPEWEHFQKSRMDARQSSIYKGAFTYGHSFVVTEMKNGTPISKGLSALKTTALYEDQANDCDPIAALTVTKEPVLGKDDKTEPGEAWMWDAKFKYPIKFEAWGDSDKITVGTGVAHGAEECPVTRFAASVDLEGRTMGVVWPMIELQNRINQTVFDLLIVQTYASFKVRTISGMAPPMQMYPVDADGNEVKAPESNADKIVDYVPRLDGAGRPIPANVNLSARRVFWAEDSDTKFGTLDETPLDGFIKAIEMAFRHMAALSQTPPHHILGEIANLSAEALTAAETALSRKIEEFKASFGESWERVFRVAAQMGGFEGADDFSGEVLWRDMEQKSLAQAGDALGKLAEQLEIPKRGLWPRVPGVTANELASWEDLREEESAAENLLSSVRRATAAGSRADLRSTTPPAPSSGVA